MRMEARFSEGLTEERVRCSLCPHHCVIKPGQTGICNTRINVEGKLYAVNYGELTALNVDPIEKKPLYHFLPGGIILSAGSFGCNFKCTFCQNHRISQGRAETKSFKVDKLIADAMAVPGNVGIAFTYNEPTTLYEFVFDTFRTIKVQNLPLKTILVTNGYISKEPLEVLLPFVDAMNIDIKSMDPLFYSSICGGQLQPVLDTVEMATKQGVHVEITTLMVPEQGMDHPQAIESVARFIARINPDIPLHLSRYFPQYQMTAPPTSVAAMEAALTAAQKHLSYVYLGNLFDAEVGTRCPGCGYVVVERQAYVIHNHLDENGTCPKCGKQVPYMTLK